MDRETHEGLLSELLNPDLEQSRKTEILQELRNSHNTAYQGVEEITTKNKKLQRDNDDLIISNSKLFRQTGVIGEKEKEEVKEQEFSETITLEEIEGSY